MASSLLLAFDVLLVLTALTGNCHSQIRFPKNIPRQGRSVDYFFENMKALPSVESSNEKSFEDTVFPWPTKHLLLNSVAPPSSARHEYILQLPVNSNTFIDLLLQMDPNLIYKLLSLVRKHHQLLKNDLRLQISSMYGGGF